MNTSELRQNYNEMLSLHDYVAKRSKRYSLDIIKEEMQKHYLLWKHLISTKQIVLLNKLLFFIKNLEKEEKLLSLGIDTYVDRKEFEEYFFPLYDGEVIRIDSLKVYTRLITDKNILSKLKKSVSIFSECYVAYYDYEKLPDVPKNERKHEVLLLGIFSELAGTHEKMVVIGTWKDNSLAGSVEEMISEYAAMKNFRDFEDIPIKDLENGVKYFEKEFDDLKESIKGANNCKNKKGKIFKKIRMNKVSKKMINQFYEEMWREI